MSKRASQNLKTNKNLCSSSFQITRLTSSVIFSVKIWFFFEHGWLKLGGVAKMRRMPYLYTSFSAKKPGIFVALLRKEICNSRHFVRKDAYRAEKASKMKNGYVYIYIWNLHFGCLWVAGLSLVPFWLLIISMGWLRWVGCLKIQVSLQNTGLFCRALLQKRPIFLSILLIVATS